MLWMSIGSCSTLDSLFLIWPRRSAQSVSFSFLFFLRLTSCVISGPSSSTLSKKRQSITCELLFMEPMLYDSDLRYFQGKWRQRLCCCTHLCRQDCGCRVCHCIGYEAHDQVSGARNQSLMVSCLTLSPQSHLYFTYQSAVQPKVQRLQTNLRCRKRWHFDRRCPDQSRGIVFDHDRKSCHSLTKGFH